MLSSKVRFLSNFSAVLLTFKSSYNDKHSHEHIANGYNTKLHGKLWLRCVSVTKSVQVPFLFSISFLLWLDHVLRYLSNTPNIEEEGLYSRRLYFLDSFIF